MVNQTCGASPGNRTSAGHNSCERGLNVDHSTAPWVAANAARPGLKPASHHSASTPTCDSASSPNLSRGLRGT